MCDVALRVSGHGRILTLDIGSGEVGAALHEGLLDRAGYGAVPAVVVEGAEECLVDRSADELVYRLVVREHVLERVRLALQPELVLLLSVEADPVRRGLARAH